MIPYTVERRQDTGVNNVTLGIWLFIASEVMLFGALFSSYVLLRVSAASWPSGQDVLQLSLGLINTFLLLPVTMFAALGRTTHRRNVRRYFIASSAFAVAFLALKGYEYLFEYGSGVRPFQNTFLAMYFTLTGLHALHVLAGLVANGWVIASTRRIGDQMLAGRARVLTIYWGFVDFIWLIILALTYLT